jgi:hypothetical protein
MNRKLDGKFHGIIVKNKDGSIVPQDEWIVFLAKDNALPAALTAYIAACEDLRAGREQVESAKELHRRVHQWRRDNPDKCKVPDTQAGEIVT